MAEYIRTREKLYRGKSIEELKKMDTREFAKLVKANPRRAIMRNFDVIEKFVMKCDKLAAKNKPIRTHSRDLIIVPALIDRMIHIHNGKDFLRVKITHEMLGHRLGEFAMTRKFTKHGAAGVGATKSSAALSVK